MDHTLTTASLVLVVVWFLVAIVLRIAFQQWRTGDTGVRRDAGPIGSVSWWARVGFVLSLVIICAGPVLRAVGGSEPDGVGDASAVRICGLLIAALGIAATVWAQLAMGDSWRIGVDDDERTELVVGGPFTLVRNPIFTTMVVSAIGFALLVLTPVAVLGAVLLVVALELQVRGVEEPHLRRVHGATYGSYCARVGRFWPGIGRG